VEERQANEEGVVMKLSDKLLDRAHKSLEAGDNDGFWRCLEMHRALSMHISGAPDKLMRGETHNRHNQLNPQENIQ
jgi:hypothetical protein